ncbi:Cystic fibrosis transmembrane conductance regulator [Fasciola gigantica]|uniref:ABC-type glutathione-S-conjugate transporter n=1 Tax=Fasciola gigantica TaxID=46835 RepID=A0A504Y2U1_FASGI|nr:Cystic fibrosis transmembrane conductance regulator [Fasciola gigantica]
MMNQSCGSLAQNFLAEWKKEFPKFPECESYILPAVLVFFCVFFCIPHILEVILGKSDNRRPVSALLFTEFLFLLLVFVNNSVQFGFLYGSDSYISEKPPYTPLAFAFVSITYFCILNVERFRDTANSGFSFFLMILATLVASVRCWNLGVDRFFHDTDPASNNSTPGSLPFPSTLGFDTDEVSVKRVLQVTDTINLIGSAVLLVMTCFSERMTQFKETYRRKSPKSKICFLRRFINKVHYKSPAEPEQMSINVVSENSTTKGSDNNDFRIPSPETYASFLSRIVYAWFLRMIIKGYRKPLELKDLWLLDKQHSAQRISEIFFLNVDRYLIPEKTANFYLERRRISLINSIAYGTNDNFHQASQTDRRRSTQSALDVDDQMYKSGPKNEGAPGPSKGRRVSEKTSLRKDSSDDVMVTSTHFTKGNQITNILEYSEAEHDSDNDNHQALNDTLRSRSVSISGSTVKDESSIHHKDTANKQLPEMNPTNANVIAPGETIGLQRCSSARRWVRIRVGSKPVFCPGQSESRSDSVITQPNEEQSGRLIDSKDNKVRTTTDAVHRASFEKQDNLQATEERDVIVDIRGSKYGRFDSERGASRSCLCCRRKSAQSGLLRVLLLTFWRPLLWSGFLKLIHDILLFVSPVLLKFLLKFLQEGSSEPIWHGYVYTALILLTQCVEVLLLQRYFRLVNILGMHIRTAITCAVYRKSLRLSNKARRESTTGQIMNLISSDAQHFVQLMPFLHIIWSGPFQIAVAIALLWNELGPSVFAGVCVLLLLLPLNVITARISKSFQEKMFETADSRIKMISEILGGIRVIKLYAWEPSFIKEVTRLRTQEIHYLRSFTFCQAISFLWTCAPFLVAITSFGVYVSISNENVLDAQKAFVSLALFNILRFPLFMFPSIASSLVQTFVSVRRINLFLRHTELNANSFSRENTPGIAAVIECGVFGWDPEDEPVLKNISIQFPEGQLTSVMGTVGSGKSSLLHALLGDMELFSGRVNINGTVAYVPQEPWIFNATLRDNILFSHPYDPVRYEQVISACGLQPDLLILPQGDLTEIGDKGINLSGGQKQRVSLARACYADADIYLLDDPLSAVDAHVGLHLLEHVLSRTTGLLASKTCILTTHSSKALPYSDRVALLINGQLSELGTYRQLLQSHTSRLSAFLVDFVTANQGQGSVVDAGLHDHQNNAVELEKSEQLVNLETSLNDSLNNTFGSHQAINRKHSSVKLALSRSHSIRSSLSSNPSEMLTGPEAHVLLSLHEGDTNENALEDKKPVNQPTNPNQLMQPEKSNVGRVKWHVFRIYLRNVGLFYCLLILILYPMTSIAQFGTSLWLADWSEDAKNQVNITKIIRNQPDILHNLSAYPDLQEDLNALYSQRNYRLGVYGALGFIQVITSLASILVFALGHLDCARKLHALLLNGILHAPAGFFDSVPAGRIINRFSQDVATVDVPLVTSMRSALMTLLQSSLTLCMACAVNPWSIIPIFCLTVLYLLLQNIYVSNSRQLRRIESVSRSPVFSHFSETLNGVNCIRAYGLTEQYAQIIDHRLDTNNSAIYASNLAQRWLAVLLESIGNFVVLFVALFAVSSRGQLSAGFTGLVISYALSLNQSLNWLVRMMADLENDIVCVERIDEYSRIEPEAAWEIPEKKPGDKWPQGKIEFINYGTRYRPDLDLVLQSISVTVNCGERIGIVGRTGSGKSSLVMGLFRMIEASEGQIQIDGIDIAQLGLHDLRSRLTLIPQDPILFSGTLRFNLDPFSEHSDSELWEGLELSHLKSFVREASGGRGLDMIISESGSNISMGQRQLICLARALLRRTRILVLDEATAAMDPITDGLIQTTIRTSFSHCTVVTIAHRLNTILDYDRVIVLHAGRIVEVGNPRELLQNIDGSFYALAKDAHLVE